ncbi:unnamed protein product, partial [Laminaria digitata]
ALKGALKTGDLSTLNAEQQALAQRIGQATEKIVSAAEIARVSELMTLAQFGPASIGTAVVGSYDDGPAEPFAQALFVARFLVEVVFAAPQSPALVPGDILREHNLDRADLSWPSAESVYRDLLARAADTIDRADAANVRIASPSLRKMLARHRMETIRQIRRLHARDPASPRARLTGLDNFTISLMLLLRLRGAS